MHDQISNHIQRTTGKPFAAQRTGPIVGGCINRALWLEDDSQRYFVKVNGADRLPIFAAEAEGLETLRGTSTLRVPKPICRGVAQDTAYLVLEYIHLGGSTAGSMAALGHALAALHRTTCSQFGWHRDNAIGSTLQINTYADNWLDFLREHRLGYQLRLAADNGLHRSTLAAAEQFLDRLGALFVNYAPSPSLLHGDLWNGNVSVDADGAPVVFDPAVYFGDREADIAMTELFGGFDRDFYAAYDAAWPRDPGYRLRKHAYNLYHVLNHFNLFGGAYSAQARAIIDRLLAATRRLTV